MSQRKPQTAPTATQFNLGEQSRIAGGDYYEISIPESIKTFLATTPSDVLDRLTQDNEDLFNYRFGFRVNRSGRGQVMEIKHRHDLTDQEIRDLHHSGILSLKRGDIKLTPSWTLPVIGWFYAVLFSVIGVVCMWAVQSGPTPNWQQDLALTIICACWAASIWFVGKVHIAPWRLVKEVGVA
jgi:hypothetical protein